MRMPKLPKVFLFACLLQGMYHEQAQKHWPLLRLLLQNPNQLLASCSKTQTRTWTPEDCSAETRGDS